MIKTNRIDKISEENLDSVPERYTVRHVLNMALAHNK